MLIFSVDYRFLLLSVDMFFILFKKDAIINKSKRRRNIFKKMNSLKKDEGVQLLNFEGDPGVPLLNFRGVAGPTSKL